MQKLLIIMIIKIPGNCTMQKLGDYHIININVRCLVIRFDTKTRDFAITTHHCYMLTCLYRARNWSLNNLLLYEKLNIKK